MIILVYVNLFNCLILCFFILILPILLLIIITIIFHFFMFTLPLIPIYRKLIYFFLYTLRKHFLNLTNKITFLYNNIINHYHFLFK